MKKQKNTQTKKDLQSGIDPSSVEAKPLKVFEYNAVHSSGNVVVCRMDGEEVMLGFGNRRFNDPREVDIDNFIHLSIPHFIRMYFILTNNLNTMKEKGIIDVKTISSNQRALTLDLEE